MGCDIHSYVEIRTPEGWQHVEQTFDSHPSAESPGELFPFRDYGLFGFLADVRNYSHVPVIADQRGLPDDASAAVRKQWDSYGHSASWLTAAELLAFDYDQVFWDRRVTKEVRPGFFDGRALAQEGEGRHLSIREFLGPFYFTRLAQLEALGDPEAVRVVFWFDS